GAGRAEVVPRAAEALVDEDGDRRGARVCVRTRDACRVGVGPQLARRGRPPLDLGDRAQALSAERLRETAHQAGTVFEKVTMRSSVAPASPESTARAAAPMPSARSSTRPAATSAPAAFT